jgi:hypothetical protein
LASAVFAPGDGMRAEETHHIRYLFGAAARMRGRWHETQATLADAASRDAEIVTALASAPPNHIDFPAT